MTEPAHNGALLFASRWAGFVAAIWLMVFSGSYAFSNYSTALKEVLGLNQKQLNRLSVAKDLGDSLGIIAGILSNYLPAYCLLCIGACIGLCGNGTQWLVVSGHISPPPYWVMFLVNVLAGNCISWMNTAVFTLSVRNFPRNRGPVVGLLKAYMGLSAAVFSIFVDVFFSSSSSMYLLMLMIVPPSCCLITAATFRPAPAAETSKEVKAEEQSLFIFNILSIALATLLMVLNLVPGAKEVIAQSVLMALLFVALMSPALVPLVLYFKMKRNSADMAAPYLANNGEDGNGTSHNDVEPVDTSSTDMEKEGLKEPLLDLSDVHASPIDWDDFNQNSTAQEEGTKNKWIAWTSVKLGEDWTTLSLFKTWHAYVLYFTLFCGSGVGMAFSNNLGQVGQSFGFDIVTLFTSLFSLGNFFGRIASGNISEYFLKVKGTPRPVWIGVAKVPMIALFAWLSMGSIASLYAGSLILGFAHGSLITLTIPTISEFYGLKYFGTNFMVLNTNLLAGSTIFSGVVAGYLYDKHASYQSDGSLTCYGPACYGTTFRLFVGFLAMALLLDALLSFVSRPLYRNLQSINTQIKGAAIKESNQRS